MSDSGSSDPHIILDLSYESTLFFFEAILPEIPAALQAHMARVIAESAESEKQAAAVEALQSLLDWEDQETDLDGRPTAPAYKVIANGRDREMIELALENAKAALQATQRKQGKEEL